MSREVEIYKATRPTLSAAAASLLTPQAEADGGPPWDVLQESTSAHDGVIINAVQSDAAASTYTIKPTGLDPETTYQVQSVDTGVLGTATGAALMTDGIDLLESPNSAAHILIITVQQ
jgi:alpha-galactosidase